ncbi:MAG: hypothetical protein UW70_C0034G0012 [Candidatus Peregrinibacteria bacterium GW2011_GWA2_44_7]|nr:MAG: hypothetical protein UW70_C0034G0012 [Candidatus Peregrinibacteria bacterium GW2011_GWA2_44_7]
MGNRLRTLSQIGSLIIVLSVFTAGNALGEEIPSGVFADVASNDRYYKAISSLAEQNIIQGYQDETFRPYQNISRAEGLKMILESLEIIPETEKSEETAALFSDVAPDAWYRPYIEMAIEKKIIGGYPDGTFHPEAPLNRAESLKIIALTRGKDTEALNLPLEIDPAKDVPIETWYANYVQMALDNAYLYKDSEGNIHPEALLQRGELADMVYRLQNPGIYSGILKPLKWSSMIGDLMEKVASLICAAPVLSNSAPWERE